jgi:CDP-glycerol glycerophosphotransferase (TagB/SpsB family)
MISNIRLKVFLQEKIFPFLSFFNERIKHDENIVMFYSNMGIRDNVGALYEYVIKNGFNERYKIICSTNDYTTFKDKIPNGVICVSNLKGLFYYFRAGYVFYSFGKIPIRPGKNQKVTQLWHGIYFKGADNHILKGHTLKNQYYTHFMSTSQFLKSMWMRIFSLKEDRIYVTGQPRNDALFNGTRYNFGDYDKIIVWMPTFRKSKVLGYQDTEVDEIVPLLPSKMFKEFNDFLARKRVKIVIKLHPMQDLSNYKMIDMNHLILLSHSEFVKRKMDLYSFIGQCDAMITDYSSVFFDYLLLDRPIGFTVDDMTEYSDNRGFNFDKPLDYMPGPHMKTLDDLYQFVEDLSNNNDAYQEKRKEVNRLFNDYIDNKSCKRVLETVGIA